MPRFARLQENTVVEIIDAPEKMSPHDLFHPDLAAQFLPCNDDVRVNWTKSKTGFSPPVGLFGLPEDDAADGEER